jgi:hypothetical protein
MAMIRNFGYALVIAVLGVAAWFALPGSRDTTQAAQAGKEPNYVHTVIFNVKKDAPAGKVDDLIADAHKLLAKIPSVRGIRAGKPAEKSTPGLSAKDYHVGLLVLFDDYDGLKAYDEHPLHKEYVQKHLPHIEKVIVYDFVNEKK